jgi:hypothetical protein
MPIMTPNLLHEPCKLLSHLLRFDISWIFLNRFMFRRRVDWRMLPLLGFLYAVALIDRTNLGIARIAGMEKDLVRQISMLLFPLIMSLTWHTRNFRSASATA